MPTRNLLTIFVVILYIFGEVEAISGSSPQRNCHFVLTKLCGLQTVIRKSGIASSILYCYYFEDKLFTGLLYIGPVYSTII